MILCPNCTRETEPERVKRPGTPPFTICTFCGWQIEREELEP